MRNGQWIGLAYYPLLLFGGIAALAVPMELLGTLGADVSWAVASLLGAICVPLFVFTIADKGTRTAVGRTRATLNRNWSDWSWREKAFSPAYGDRATLLLNRLIWVEAAASLFVSRAAFAIAFAGFALTTLLLFLLLAYPRRTAHSNSTMT